MSFKSILVHVEPNEASDARVAVAADLARRFSGRVVGVGARAFPHAADLGGALWDGQALQALREAAEDLLDEAEARFRAGAEGVESLWRGFVDEPAPTVVHQSRLADLVVASTTPRHCDDTAFAHAGDLIMSTGLPVLLLPAGCSAVPARRILIGWKNTLQTRAAISAALPFLKAADEVLVARIKAGEDAGADEELADVAGRLACHGVNAATEAHARSARCVADDLLGLASRRSLDLLVTGAYAHTRLTEWVFGGVTDDLLTATSVPVLFGR